jgi:hypothetical protein
MPRRLQQRGNPRETPRAMKRPVDQNKISQGSSSYSAA